MKKDEIVPNDQTNNNPIDTSNPNPNVTGAHGEVIPVANDPNATLLPGKTTGVMTKGILGDIEMAIEEANKKNHYEKAAKLNAIMVRMAELQQELKSSKDLDKNAPWFKSLNDLYIVK